MLADVARLSVFEIPEAMATTANKRFIADNTMDNAKFCFSVSGAEVVSKKTGADLIYPSSSLMREMKLRGHRLDVAGLSAVGRG